MCVSKCEGMLVTLHSNGYQELFPWG